MNVRTERSGDADAIDDVVRRAFGSAGDGDGEPEARLVRELRKAPEYDPALSFVAEVDGRIVGHLLFTPIRIEDGDTAHEALALAPLSVVRGFERLHAGTRLMRHGLAACGRSGHDVVVVLGHPKYYARFGFEPASEHGISGPYAAAGEAFRVLALQPGALDGVSGTVVYPQAFLDV